MNHTEGDIDKDGHTSKIENQSYLSKRPLFFASNDVNPMFTKTFIYSGSFWIFELRVQVSVHVVMEPSFWNWSIGQM